MKSAIITADIVRSSALSNKQEQMLLEQLRVITSGNNLLEFYRGDSFQVYLPEAPDALLWVLKARAAAKSIPSGKSSMPLYDIRASIGIGKVETPFSSLGSAKGEAFLLSGRTFDEMTKEGERLIISHGGADQKTHLLLKIIARYVDHLFAGLTSKQAAVVFQLLGNATQQEISAYLRKSQPTINRLAKAARWNEISQLLEDYKQVITLA